MRSINWGRNVFIVNGLQLFVGFMYQPVIGRWGWTSCSVLFIEHGEVGWGREGGGQDLDYLGKLTLRFEGNLSYFDYSY